MDYQTAIRPRLGVALGPAVLIMLGSTVITGWLVGIPALIQLHHKWVPMQFNTALAFVLLGLGILAWQRENRGGLLATALCLLALGGVTLLQYVFSIDLGLDELFMEHYILTGTSHPGRMGPNTALCMVLVALVFLFQLNLPGRWLLMTQGGVIVLIFAISFVAVSGYLSGLSSGYSWGHLTQMAMHTAVGLMFTALCLYQLHRQHIRHLPSGGFSRQSCIYVFVLLTSLTLTLWQALVRENIHNQHQIHALKAEQFKAEFSIQWANHLSSLYRMLSRWETTTDTNARKQQARALLQDNAAFIAMSLTSGAATEWSIPGRGALPTFLQQASFRSVSQGFISQPLTLAQQRLALMLKLPVQTTTLEGGEWQRLLVLVSLEPVLSPFTDTFALDGIGIEIRDARQLLVKTQSGSYQGSWNKTLIPGTGLAFRLTYNADNSGLANWLLVGGLLLSAVISGLIYFLHLAVAQSKKIVREVREKQHSQNQLFALQNKTQLAAEVSGLLIWEWDPHLDHFICDEKLFSMLRLPSRTSGKPLGLETFLAAVDAKDRQEVRDGLADCLNLEQGWRGEFRMRGVTMEPLHFRGHARAVRRPGDHSSRLVGGLLDISAEHRMLEHLQSLRQQAEDASQAKSEFLANMSHELRTPMNGILGISELMAQSKLTAKQGEYLGLIQTSASSLLKIINDILDLSKIEAGELQLEKHDVVLGALVGDMLKTFSPMAHSKGIELSYFIADKVPSVIAADPVRLSQLLSNLVANGIKFTEFGGVHVEINLADHPAGESGKSAMLSITIEDSGVGVAKDKHQAIFAKFRQADTSTSRQHGGTGLGLSIVSQLVQLMGGKLAFDSTPGQGTTVSLLIPGEPVTKVASPEVPWVNATGPKRCKVLIVDASVANGRWIQQMLHSWGVTSRVAIDGEAALELLSEDTHQPPFDLVLLDCQPDVLSLSDFVREIKDYAPGSKIALMMTSGIPVHRQQEICALGLDTHILKPVKQSEIFNLLIDGDAEALLPQEQKQIVKTPHPLHILLAEDNPVNQQLVQDILALRGHQVSLVEDGRSAVSRCHERQYDAVLMDVQMPIMDGLEATRLIRDAEQAQPSDRRQLIIGLTAKALQGDRETCLQAGMDDYMSKPVDAGKMCQLIESACADRESLQPTNQNLAPVDAYQHLDMQRCIATTGGNASLLHKMMTLTRGQLTKELNHIEQCQRQQQWQEAAKTVHRLKGTIGNFCNQQLIDQIRQLETLLAREQQESVQAWQRVQQQLLQFDKEVQVYLEDNAQWAQQRSKAA